MATHNKLRRWIFSGISQSVLTVNQLDEFTAKQLKRKSELNITGRVLYANGKFISILEGEETPLARHGRVIEGDERHNGIATIQFKAVKTREFSDWTACYYRPPDYEIQIGAINLDNNVPPIYLGFPENSETYIYFYAFWHAEVS